MHPLFRSAALLLCGILAACTAPSQSFIRMAHSAPRGGKIDPLAVPRLSDALALNYADATITLLRSKYNGARVARDVAQVVQVGFAAATGAAAAFNYSTRTVALLGIGTAVVPELQRIVDAKGRAQVYQDAVRLIEEAVIEYLANNQRPTDDLTQNGVTLLQRTTASIHLVEKTLTGTLPTIEDLRKATEPMSPRGAVVTRAGSAAPVNNTPADPAAGPGAAAREAARTTRVRQEVTTFTRRTGRTTDKPITTEKVKTTPFDDRVNAVSGRVSELSDTDALSIARTKLGQELIDAEKARDLIWTATQELLQKKDEAELKGWEALVPPTPKKTG